MRTWSVVALTHSWREVLVTKSKSDASKREVGVQQKLQRNTGYNSSTFATRSFFILKQNRKK
jgi:hypothetical protein